ncbi:MAG: hypothetical protein SX243_15800 [Acidobacteriota bacterium]|nr:hypothetical protein [Acidobacteriota bacterium]
MKAIKLASRVTKDHKVQIDLPEEVREGPVEIIVLLQDDEEPALTAPASGTTTLGEVLAARRPDSHWIRSKEELDAALEVERASWD